MTASIDRSIPEGGIQLKVTARWAWLMLNLSGAWQTWPRPIGQLIDKSTWERSWLNVVVQIQKRKAAFKRVSFTSSYNCPQIPEFPENLKGELKWLHHFPVGAGSKHTPDSSMSKIVRPNSWKECLLVSLKKERKKSKCVDFSRH